MNPGPARLILEFFRLVDNMTYSFRNKEPMITCAKEIESELNKYSLPLKNTFDTNDPTLPEDKSSEIIYGYVWCKKTDTLTPNLEYSIHKKRAGVRSGPPLTQEPPEDRMWTRRTVCRIAMQTYNPRGTTAGPFLMGIKKTFVNLQNPWPRPTGYLVHTLNPELAKETT